MSTMRPVTSANGGAALITPIQQLNELEYYAVGASALPGAPETRKPPGQKRHVEGEAVFDVRAPSNAAGCKG